MESAFDLAARYELASFLASPESEAFAEMIAAEWRASREYRSLDPDRFQETGAFGELAAETFRRWLARRVRESRAISGNPAFRG